MRYIEVRIDTAQEGVDPLTCILMDMGIAGFAIEDARDFQDLIEKRNPYDWDYIDESLWELSNATTRITFYLAESEESRKCVSLLQKELDKLKQKRGKTFKGIDFGSLDMNWKLVDDADWKDNWKEYFKPAKITKNIVVKPTWEAYEANEGEQIIEIDPGMAFGTGTHPTTSLCIKLLEKYMEPGKDTVLDVGCGSGILSIAAALLGARDIMAVDIDPIAVQVAKENVEWNHLSSRISVQEGDLTKGLEKKAEIVVANLMADLVMRLSKDAATHLQGKSIYISSGILIEKCEMVASAIEECGFHVLEILEEGEWCAIAAQV